MNIAQRINIACYSEFRRISLSPGVTFLVSALAKEGKTLIATELAISNAMKGGNKKPILIVDLNSFNQTAGNLLLTDKQGEITGLVDFMKNRVALSDCIHTTEIPRMFLLPYGTPDDDFEPLQHLAFLEDLIKNKLKQYTVIVDTGAIFMRNRRNFDPVEICASADSILLVILSGKTPREIVQHCLKNIEAMGAKVDGIIMNDFFVKPFRSQIAQYLSWIAKIPGAKKPINYIRARLGIF